MIALIALVALAMVVGVVIGIIALIVAIAKAMARVIRRTEPSAATSSGEAGIACTLNDELEFERIVSREWPSS